MKILAYKQPFDAVKADYAKIIDDLQKTWISDDVQEDKGGKTTIANINLGLLGKSKSSEKPYLQLIEGSSFLSAPVWGINIFHQSRRRRAMVGG